MHTNILKEKKILLYFGFSFVLISAMFAQKLYKDDYIERIAFPIGGIGAGSFSIEGNGSVAQMSIHHHPEVFHEPSMYAAIHIKGGNTKVLEGQIPKWKLFGTPGASNGLTGKTYGLSRFRSNTFQAKFPYAEVKLMDESIPLACSFTAWSPFIPNDADNSSLPVGAIEYVFKNNSNKAIEAIFSYSSSNFTWANNKNQRIKSIKNGFLLQNDSNTIHPEANSQFAIFTDQSNTLVNHCWFRGGWFDSQTMNWSELSKGIILQNPPINSNAPGATLYVPFELQPGQTKVIKVLMAWYVPQSSLRIGEEPTKESDTTPEAKNYYSEKFKFYTPWYASKFKSIDDLISFWDTKYSDLNDKTQLFSSTFFDTDLPEVLIEAVAANLCILKSPTVMRDFDGRLWNWEGSGDNEGSCHGSCTHVWNYAQAIPNLFPSLEKTLRETEFFVSQDKFGHQNFRSNLPIRPVSHIFHAAVDGQLGGIIKTYRDWRINGDTKWLKNIYPKLKQSLDFCIATWDPDKTGLIVEPHHNTYDIEFWGANGMTSSFYIGALKAFVEMGNALKENTVIYRKILISGSEKIEKSLFNGEYFIQKVEWKKLKSLDPITLSKNTWNSDYSSPEAQKMLENEGPKYQYSSGCLSDGVIGFWLSSLSGLKISVDNSMILSHVNSVYKYNFKTDLVQHSNPQRPTYANGNEKGLLLCTWPKGDKPSLPFVYSDEVWTGIEYQVASHLIALGEVQKGLDIVAGCRERYDGKKRNPFDEYEFGHWYGRALSSYALLQAYTGVRYDAVEKVLYVNSNASNFKSFLSTATGFGSVISNNGKISINVVYGAIQVDDVRKIE